MSKGCCTFSCQYLRLDTIWQHSEMIFVILFWSKVRKIDAVKYPGLFAGKAGEEKKEAMIDY